MFEIPLDGKVWEFVMPPYALCQDLLIANASNESRAQAAAVGLCLVEVGTAGDKTPVKFYPKLSYLATGCSALAYGGGIIDEARRRRVPNMALARAGLQCLEWVSKDFEIVQPPTAEELKAAEDFTDLPAVSGD